MNVYEVNHYAQPHYIVCDSFKEAEEIFNNKYPDCTIKKIEMISIFVEVKEKKNE